FAAAGRQAFRLNRVANRPVAAWKGQTSSFESKDKSNTLAAMACASASPRLHLPERNRRWRTRRSLAFAIRFPIACHVRRAPLQKENVHRNRAGEIGRNRFTLHPQQPVPSETQSQSAVER